MTKLVIFFSMLLLPLAANAYVGPGSGITAIGSILALIAALVVGILGFVWYPIKRFRKKRLDSKKTTDNARNESELELQKTKVDENTGNS